MKCQCSHLLPTGAKFCPECGSKAPKPTVTLEGFAGELPAVMCAAEAADLLKCSLWMIYELAKQDKVPHFRLGSRLRFSTKALIEWAENQRTITTTDRRYGAGM